MSILGIVVFSLFASLFARLYYLQIMAPEAGEVEAANNRVRLIHEEAPRGRILDLKGRVIVDNRTSLVVTIDPHALGELKEPERDAVILRLSEELTKSGIPTKVAAIERRLDDPQFSPLQPIPVAIDVPADLMVYLAERAEEFPSVQLRRESVRSYPQGSMAAHVLGYVGRISRTQLEARMGTLDEPLTPPKPYAPDSGIGKTGIEATFEDDLRGAPGVKKVEVDRDGKVVREIVAEYQRPVPGHDVQLTIDMDLQKSTETALADQLESLRGQFTADGKYAQAKAGSAVVLDPTNGNVVAMASYPTYDPTEFVNGISTDRYNELVPPDGQASDNPLTNRAIAGLYAPGSTFKLVTAHAGLEHGLIKAEDGYQDNGFYMVGTQRFQNARGEPKGWVQLPLALTVSSDVFFYWLGDRFWRERDKGYGDGIQASARQFGYSLPTGIQLPDELGGVIPDPAWKKQFWESLPEDARARDGDRWYAGDNVNLSIGQGYVLATPLQIANSYATLASGGARHRPNLVLRVVRGGGDPNNPADVIRSIAPEVQTSVHLPPEFAGPLNKGLSDVTKDPRGTATHVFKEFDQSSFAIMGKTGTAQVGTKADNSLFVGVGPENDPRYVAIAILEESGFGSDAAGPVVLEIFKKVAGQGQHACPEAASDGSTASTTSPPTTAAANGAGVLASQTCPTDPNAAAGAGAATSTVPSGVPTYTVPTAPTYTVPTTAPNYTVPSYTVPSTAPVTTPSTVVTPIPTAPPTTFAPVTTAPVDSTPLPEPTPTDPGQAPGLPGQPPDQPARQPSPGDPAAVPGDLPPSRSRRAAR